MTGRGDGISPLMCLRCGMKGRHETADDCITALRDQLAVLQFKLGANQKRSLPRYVAG